MIQLGILTTRFARDTEARRRIEGMGSETSMNNVA
jgi:hypothetical protein